VQLDTQTDIHYCNGTSGETVASFEFEAIRLGDAISEHKLDRWLPADGAIWICAADRRHLLAVSRSGFQKIWSSWQQAESQAN